MSIATAQGQDLPPSLVRACLDELTQTLSERPGVPADQRLAHANATELLVLSFQPRDGMQLLLAGQAVLFHALTSDAAREILSGMAEPMKPRALSTVAGMGRLVSKHVDTVIRLQARADRGASRTDAPAESPNSPAELAPPRETRGDEPAMPVEPTPETLAAEAPPQPTIAPPAGRFPGREKMLASRASRNSRRKKTLPAHQPMKGFRTAQAG